MSRRFPHLSDTAFPDLETVSPYRRETTFDYGRYDYAATVKLCNVTWPYDYSHVVNWKGEAERDAYFDSIAGPVVELQQGFTRTQQDSVAVPVPYDVALTYGYVYMRVPMLTEDAAIDYETGAGIRTVCAFITDVIYQAPSTTLLVLDVDWWTTYLPHLSINSMMLRRGHAPMWALTADDYLKDPQRNCALLLTPDVDFGSTGMVRHGELMPLSTAEPMLVLASTIPYSAIDSIPTATTASSTAPTYYDTGARNGEQVGVSGFVWAPDGKAYAGMGSPGRVTHLDGDKPMGLYYYALVGSDMVAGSLGTLASSLPVFITSVQAAYVVPSDLVNAGTQHVVAGVTLHEVYSREGWQDVGTFEIRKADFGYPSRYAGIAKLYTYPYAHVEISDDSGGKVSVRVEQTDGTIDMQQLVSATWPMLTWDVAIANVGNLGGDASYVWTTFAGNATARKVTNADFADMLMSFDFPTYALYLTAETEEAMRRHVMGEKARHDAIVAYQSTMRSANTAEHNAYDSNATAKTNADASADTAKTNADASADTAKTNADASADTAKGNTTRTTQNMTTNASRQNSYRSTDQRNAETYPANTADIDVTFVRGSTFVAQLNNQVAAVAGISNAMTQTAGSVAGSLLAGNEAGALLAGANGAAGAIVAGAGYPVTVSTESTLATLSENSILDKALEVASFSYINSDNANAQNTEITANNVATADDNATDTRDTTKANATRTQTTAKANATRTQGTTKGNATRTKGTADANANYTRDTTEENAKAALENAQSDYLDSIQAYMTDAARQHGQYSGTAIHEQMRNRGVHMRIVTEDDSAISRAGDAFLRYGYAFDGYWPMCGGWCPNDARYCYWESSDITQDMTIQANPMASRAIRTILEQGVTVWDNPDKVGRW